MAQTTGKCPICHKSFAPDDDVVTCPSCGAPYHRACYQEKGACIYSDKHAQGFEYTPPEAAASSVAGAGASAAGHSYGAGAGAGATTQPGAGTGRNSGGILCLSCRTVNDAKNIFCENCGAPLHTATGQPGAGYGPGQQGPGSFSAPGGGFGGYPGMGAMPGFDMQGSIAGISVRDWMAYIGQSAPQYLRRLATMEQSGNKVSFLFSAFIFSPGYFAYRKMWGWAAISLAATLLLMVPQLLFIAADYGIALPFSISLHSLEVASAVAGYISLAMRLGFGIFAMFLFRKNAVKQIGLLRQQSPDELQYQEKLVKKGGVSPIGVIIVVSIIVLLSVVLSLYMGNAMVQYFYPGLFV